MRSSRESISAQRPLTPCHVSLREDRRRAAASTSRTTRGVSAYGSRHTGSARGSHQMLERAHRGPSHNSRSQSLGGMCARRARWRPLAGRGQLLAHKLPMFTKKPRSLPWLLCKYTYHAMLEVTSSSISVKPSRPSAKGGRSAFGGPSARHPQPLPRFLRAGKTRNPATSCTAIASSMLSAMPTRSTQSPGCAFVGAMPISC